MCFLPGAQQFLMQLRSRGLRVVLVTNAHQESLSVKAQRTGLIEYFHSAVSSHQYGVPKEHPQFWPKLEAQLQFDPQRALMVDDNLAVLRAAYDAVDWSLEYTDEAGLVEAMGIAVGTFAGDPANIKITTPRDLALAEALWRALERSP